MIDVIIRWAVSGVLIIFGIGMIVLFIVLLRLAWEDRKKQKEEEE